MNNDTNPSESHDHFVKKAVLGGILATYLKKHPRGVAIGTQLLSWHKVVTSILDASFTTRSKAVKIDNHRLIITCTDVATVSELFLHKEELLAAYKQLFHSLAFSELLFLYKNDENKTTSTSSLTPQSHLAAHNNNNSNRIDTDSDTSSHTVLTRGTRPYPLEKMRSKSSVLTDNPPPKIPHHHPSAHTQITSEYPKWVSERELQTYYPDIGLASAFLTNDYAHDS
ncbi:hypothetical protein COTS27_00549 [Spirochaetota bacterium]|nr:hypothetical protein COTS27_00549 [Spirochaetota bacterium]